MSHQIQNSPSFAPARVSAMIQKNTPKRFNFLVEASQHG
jgi:hypothetical protein